MMAPLNPTLSIGPRPRPAPRRWPVWPLWPLWPLWIVLALAPLLAAADAQAATSACNAATIIAAEPCTNPASCHIAKDYDVGDGCVLDFGARDVTIASSSRIAIDANMATIRADDFTVEAGALIDARTSAIGGFLKVEATGSITVAKAGGSFGRILANGNARGGTIVLEAQRDVVVDGRLHATNSGIGTASGGTVMLRAGGDILTGSGSDIALVGGKQGCGGLLDLAAGGHIQIGSAIDVSGGDGGVIAIDAGGDVLIDAKLSNNGNGDAGSGSCVDILAVGDITANDKIISSGSGSASDFGGCGGVVVMAAGGHVTIAEEVNTDSGPPDGGAGSIDLASGASVTVGFSGLLSARGVGIDSCGGEVAASAVADISINGEIDASGGGAGGTVSAEAGRDIRINRIVRLNGREFGSFGGVMAMTAGALASGRLSVSAAIDASGAVCGSGLCGLGGDVDLAACDLTVGVGGSIATHAQGVAGEGGETRLMARGPMTIAGILDATGAGGPQDGSIILVHPSGQLPVVLPSGSIQPQPMHSARSHCTGAVTDDVGCLLPCPSCGNGSVTFPETCDDIAGTPRSCDGCSWFCQLENCDDQSACSIDACDPEFGCRNTPLPDGSICTDETVCNGNEMCIGGECLSDMSLDCDDGNPCTDDACDPALGCHHTLSPAGSPCEEGDLCSEGDMCNGAGVCVPGGPANCDDGNECTLSNCSPQTGCTFSPAETGTPCADDGDLCTNDICIGGTGKCFHLFICDDGDSCTIDRCEDIGCTHERLQTPQCNPTTTTTVPTTTTLAPTTTTTVPTTTTLAPTSTTAAPTTTTLAPTTTTVLSTTTTLAPTTTTVLPTTTTLASTTTTVLPTTTTLVSTTTVLPTTTTLVSTTTTVLPTTTTLAPTTTTTPTTTTPAPTTTTTPLPPVAAPGCGANADCDDANPCTDDICDAARNCTHTPNASVCPTAPVGAKKLSVEQRSKAKRNKLLFISRTARELPVGASAPTEAGASLQIRDGGGQVASFDLPPQAWKRKGAKGFAYRDKAREHGPCTKVSFKRGKVIRATCTGEQMNLQPPLQAPVELVLRMGNFSYCATFGGRITQSAGTFVAKGAAIPTSCPFALSRP